MTTDSPILTGRRGSYRIITLNRPDRLNAFNEAMHLGLRKAIEEAEADEGCRALLITGAGRGFCTGQDLNDRLAKPGETVVLGGTLEAHYNPLVRKLRALPFPVVAAVNGVAAGAGAVIALAADLRLLARSARFAFLFTRVGLAGADMGSAYLLPRVIGFGRATELLLLGDTVDAQRALEIGLATAVVDDEALAETALTMARRLAEGPALAYSTTKVLLTRELDMGLGGSLELDAMTQALLMGSHDHAEYHRAWTEGRAPAWEGR